MLNSKNVCRVRSEVGSSDLLDTFVIRLSQTFAMTSTFLKKSNWKKNFNFNVGRCKIGSLNIAIISLMILSNQ